MDSRHGHPIRKDFDQSLMSKEGVSRPTAPMAYKYDFLKADWKIGRQRYPPYWATITPRDCKCPDSDTAVGARTGDEKDRGSLLLLPAHPHPAYDMSVPNNSRSGGSRDTCSGGQKWWVREVQHVAAQGHATIPYSTYQAAAKAATAAAKAGVTADRICTHPAGSPRSNIKEA